MTGQTDLSAFESAVYDPSEEFTGSDVVARDAAMDRLQEKYRFASESGAGRDGPAKERALAEMDVYADAMEALQDGADVNDLAFRMAQRGKGAGDDLDAATTDAEDARARGEQTAASDVVDVLTGDP